jgi:DNA processing protein
MDDTKYWVAFTRIPSLGTVRFRLLEGAFGSLEEAWGATPAALTAAGLDRRAVASVAQLRPGLDPDAEMAQLETHGVHPLTWRHPDYPPFLKEIHDPPPVLFIKGTLLPQDQRAVAVVGTRRATAYGREACEALVGDLARSGVTIVSGLARGIDSVAHRAALQAGGRTLAVMGSGLDVMYPPEHRGLADEIVAAGALVGEHPLGTRPAAQHFPRRNRIISGISLGVLAVEAPEASGVMWTVRSALEQGREVFAVPGSIFSPASQGVNRLLQQGAKLVLSYTDVLEELNLSALGGPGDYRPEQLALPAGESPKGEGDGLLGFVGHEPIHIDEVGRRAGLPIAQVSSALAILELQGQVKQVGAMHYVRAREPATPYRAVS